MNPIAATNTTPDVSQLNAFIQQRLNAPDPSGRPNLFQVVDQINISAQAKQQVEQSMAQDMLASSPASATNTASSTASTSQTGMPGALFALMQSGNTGSLSSALQQMQQGRTDFMSAVQEISQGQSQGQTDLSHALGELKAGRSAMHSAMAQALQNNQASSWFAPATDPSTTDPLLAAIASTTGSGSAAGSGPFTATSATDPTSQLSAMLMQILSQPTSLNQSNSSQLLAAYTQSGIPSSSSVSSSW